MNIYGALNIARWALFSQQTAVEVAGHNIANVNTEGYTRQQAVIEASYPIPTTPGQIGTGVRVTEIKRAYDNFLGSQINSETNLLGKWTSKEEALSRAEVVFNETTGGGLNKYLTEFWSAWQDLSLNPAGETGRQAVIGKGKLLSDTFNKLSTDLKRIRDDIDKKIVSTVDEINQFTGQVAELNKTIHESEVTGENANDLRDKRELIIKKLAERIDVNYYEDSTNKQAIVYTAKGRPIVTGQYAFQLQAVQNAENAALHDVKWKNVDGTLTDLSSDLTGGNLAGLIEARDSNVQQYLKKLDILSASIVKEVNKKHVTGYGLDKSTGVNFFNVLSVTTKAGASNTGSATVSSGSLSNPQVAATDNYEVRFTSSSSYSIYNATQRASSGTFTFSSGSAITFFQQKGITVSVSGSASSGDRFVISASENSAGTMAVNSTVEANTKKIAAAKSEASGDGDNALSIGSLQSSLIIGGSGGAASGTYTFNDYYNAVVGTVGLDTSTAKDNVKQREAVKLQLENRRENISGVSLDQEMTDLIKFQRAYGAAAKLIGVVDELLTTLLSTVR
ncbi:MAG: flagellar hook-associated protein FlgK [Nitrospinae bacterium]|nr:flagellar hook-associated protein FlgK [Nitrospinota bacterium]MBI3814363.1 flagellar hook-associated protein FlgK [Nitrospinota bacterium]